MEVAKVTIKDGILNLASSNPLVNPKTKLTAKAAGTDKKPIDGYRTAKIIADNFRTLGTEKSNEPMRMTRVKPHAATKKKDMP